MFDRVEIKTLAGKGGDGAISFRREKYVPFGGPDGGDGGKGGDVVVMADTSVASLSAYRHKKHYRAESGGPGGGQRKHGKNGDDRVLRVPVGTEVSRLDAGEGASLLADLTEPGQSVVVAEGGQGGWGNTKFATSTNQTPRMAQRGEEGREAAVLLELKLIADVGIIGYPNAGKSSLLAAATAAHPKIAGYPFTTLDPELGAVEVGRDVFVMAEVPGLIEDAHRGRGLGHEFLRHVARTRLLIHLVDGASASPLEDVQRINDELRLYDSQLAEKPQLVTVNKIDLPEVRAAVPRIREQFAAVNVTVNFISAATGEGITGLMAEVNRALLDSAPRPAEAAEAIKVFRPQPRTARVSVHREEDTYVVTSSRLERLMSQDSKGGPPSYYQLKPYLEKLGIERALKQAGVKAGERVRCGRIEWVWEDIP